MTSKTLGHEMVRYGRHLKRMAAAATNAALRCAALRCAAPTTANNAAATTTTTTTTTTATANTTAATAANNTATIAALATAFLTSSPFGPLVYCLWFAVPQLHMGVTFEAIYFCFFEMRLVARCGWWLMAGGWWLVASGE